jgi:hypothetical protein
METRSAAWGSFIMKAYVAAVIGLAASALPAAADTRDLVLERSSRCYALTDTRQYLECLYGAMQPLRSELGLPPAPQANSFAALFARPAAQAAYVPPAAPVAAAPARPLLVPQQQPRHDPGLASDVFSTVLGMKTTRVAPEQFGLRNARASANGVDHITARLAEYDFDRRTGLFTVTLDNGQVWQQQKGDDYNPSWKKPAASYVATISYGAMGTYNLSVAGERQRYKVQRTR